MKSINSQITNFKLSIPIILFTFIFFSCNNLSKENKKKMVKDSTELVDTVKTNKVKKVSKKNNLLGIWNIDDEPVFEIRIDSIYYIDNDRSYKYKLKDSIIFIYYDDFTYKGTISLKKSKQLIMKDSLNTNYYNK